MDLDNTDLRIAGIAAALEAYSVGKKIRTERVPYKGAQEDLPVVRVNPNLLLLNPNNSRLRAQLEDIPEKLTVHAEPKSEAAQIIISDLLRETVEYKRLKDQLSEFGQEKPGLVARDGLLINGNTRVVALRDLGVDGVDVAVLPPDATSKDYFDIETALQLTNWVHQDYTFTNQLLMMKAHLDAGVTKKDLGKKLKWRRAVSKVEQYMRMLQMINEVRKKSNPTLKFSVFDSKKEHLKDLDEKYESLKSQGKIQEAESLKWTRLYAILLGINKDQVRAMEADFIIDEVEKRGESDSDAIKYLEQYKNDEASPIDDIFEDDDEHAGLDIQRMVQDLVSDPSIRNENGSINVDLPGKYEEMERILRLGANAKIEIENQDSAAAKLTDRIRDARIALQVNIDTFAERATGQGFDRIAFEKELEELEITVKNLKATAYLFFGEK